ncbi:MAG: phenylalanine--tRNA ligase subunit beta [Patescibacteria group bacterium]|nr:phenylalanine--tRNA ligase subunit beta [Patescibacteria group bacterium]
MLISHKWLQNYFDKSLPWAKDVAQALADHIFEIDEIRDLANDQVLDVDVQPNRAHDCLSHRGIARELSAILNRSIAALPISADLSLDKDMTVKVVVDDAKLCRRYQARVVSGVAIAESPEWLKEALESIDQRPINNVVDIANYVMFDLGQPLHAFDADKVVGDVVVRLARAGEAMTTLDDQELTLDPTILIIADDQGPLGVAGIKGGKRAGVTQETKRLILEAANFDPVLTRRASAKLTLRTDASKRFENGMTVTLTAEAMDKFSQLLQQTIGGDIKFGPVTDTNPKLPTKRAVEMESKDFTRLLGVEIKPETIVDILTRLRCKATWHEDQLRVVVPEDRLDLNVQADIVEEVGRLYGYDNIPNELPDLGLKTAPNKSEQLSNKIREVLISQGFSEIHSHTLVAKGEVEIANPLASDKNFLRADLSTSLQQKIAGNLPHLLFEKEAMKLFEIGHVFSVGKERINLAIGIGWRTAKYKQEGVLTEIWGGLKKSCGLKVDVETKQTDALEYLEMEDLETLADEMGGPLDVDLTPYLKLDVRFQPVSLYPRIVRDLALFVPIDTESSAIGTIIADQAGELLVEGPTLFDQFEKEGRVSYAFRSAFQAVDRTLTDDEVNQIMDRVISTLEQQEDWEVRK